MDLAGLWQERLKEITDEIYDHCLKELRNQIPTAGHKITINLSKYNLDSKSPVIHEIIRKLELLGLCAKYYYFNGGISRSYYDLEVTLPRESIKKAVNPSARSHGGCPSIQELINKFFDHPHYD